jgi:sec-independent protein translocase protein TatC
MSSAATTSPAAAADHRSHEFDPEQYRMTIGEHLEELRRRFILGLVGFVAVAIFCFIFGKQVVSYFCQPLVDALEAVDVNPQIYITATGDAFMVYMQIGLICAAAISSPWIIYQLWLFVAAGLYPHERKYVTKYVPLSISLLIGGMLFVYFLVLPWTLSFFLTFAVDIPLRPSSRFISPKIEVAPETLPKLPSLKGDPKSPPELGMWYNEMEKRLKMHVGGQIRVIPFGPSNLLAPHITLPEYIDLVVGMLIVFGLAFQLPLIVLALMRIGILELETAKAARKYVYFAMTIAAAVITPGDVITATIALMIPLCLLYELGIFLYVMGNRPKKPATK